MTNLLEFRRLSRAMFVLMAGVFAAVWMPRSVEATLITIDFDNLTFADVITNQFSGVEFSLLGSPPTAGPIAYALKDGSVANTGDPVDIFGASGLAMSSATLTSITIDPPYFDIQVSFADSIDFFSIMVLDAEESFSIMGFLGDILVQEVLSSSISPIGTWVGPTFAGPVYSVSLGAIGGDTLFGRIVIDLNNSGDNSGGPEVYDNLTYNTVTIPEPSTLALFAMGLAGLGFMGWRRDRVYGKDMISVQATACAENQGLPYTWT